MNKYLIFMGVILFICCTLVIAQEAPVKNPIVNINKVVNFGIWRIYNSGRLIYIADREEGNFLYVNTRGNKGNFFQFSTTDGLAILLPDGTLEQFGKISAPIDALTTEPSGNLQDGRYGFGSARFLVNEDTMTIFHVDDETTSGEIIPATILEKYTNGATYIGTATSITIDPTTVLDANDIAEPAAILGDCLASYSGPTEIIIPCLSVEGDDTVYRVKLKQQTPNALIFDVDLEEVSRVQ